MLCTSCKLLLIVTVETTAANLICVTILESVFYHKDDSFLKLVMLFISYNRYYILNCVSCTLQ